MRLYQDAHVLDHMLPKIELDGGKVLIMKVLNFLLFHYSRIEFPSYVTGIGFQLVVFILQISEIIEKY